MSHDLCLWHMRRQHFLFSVLLLVDSTNIHVTSISLLGDYFLHFNKCVKMQVFSSANSAIWLAKSLASL